MRGYSGTATKWVDFVVTDSTRRESCHVLRVLRNADGVKKNWWKNRLAVLSEEDEPGGLGSPYVAGGPKTQRAHLMTMRPS